MTKSNEEVIEELYFEVGQMFFHGMNEEDIFKVLYERDLVEKIARFIIKESKNNFIKVSNTLKYNNDGTFIINEIIEGKSNGKEYPIIDVREFEKYTTKEDLLDAVGDIPCIVFFDSERVLTDDIYIENKDIHNRKFAWKRTYHIEGNNVEHKAAMMQILTEQEFDGYDYIEIQMHNEAHDFFIKFIRPNGETNLTGMSNSGELLDSIVGHVDNNTNI